MGGWLKAVCQTGVFIICAQVLVHCRPNSSYEKYLKLLVSAMILVQLFLPISHFFFKAGAEDLETRVQWFREQLEETMGEREGAQAPDLEKGENRDGTTDDNRAVEKIERVEIAPIVIGEE